MKTLFKLEELQGTEYDFVQNDIELAAILETIGLPEKYHEDITGVVLLLGEGDYIAVWLTESNRYYDLQAIYRPLPFYRPSNWKVSYLPIYWHRRNVEYK